MPGHTASAYCTGFPSRTAASVGRGLTGPPVGQSDLVQPCDAQFIVTTQYSENWRDLQAITRGISLNGCAAAAAHLAVEPRWHLFACPLASRCAATGLDKTSFWRSAFRETLGKGNAFNRVDSTGGDRRATN